MWRREYVENVTKNSFKKMKIKKRITLALNAYEVSWIVTHIWIAYFGCSKQGKVFYKMQNHHILTLDCFAQLFDDEASWSMLGVLNAWPLW